MLTRERSLEIFLGATDDLINSKYILADSKVGPVLKAVAQSRLLYETFEYVTDGFDYAAAKGVCFVDGGVALPQKDEDLLAFCFLLLMEIDAKKEDVIRLLTEYFNGNDGMQAAYANFAQKLLIPFRDTAKRTFEKMMSGELPAVRKKTPEEVAKEEKKAGKKTSAVRYAETLCEDEIARSGDDKCEELAYILKELREAIENEESDKITLAYLALKYAIKAIKRPKIDLNSITEEVSAAL